MRLLRPIIAALVTCATVAVAPAVCAAGPNPSAAAEMACCKAGHRTCHQQGSAADCCKKVRAAAPQGQTGTLAAQTSVSPPPCTSVHYADEPALASHWIISDAFKRPHDPPHLHAFTLLI